MKYCSFTSIYETHRESRCSFVKTHCSGEYSYFNIAELHFCTFNESYILSYLLLIGGVLLLFRIISETSEEYLSVSLNRISRIFKMSESLTGVTLLALATGAPDIITSMIAGGETGGISMSIGSLYGASMFVFNIVFASVILQSPNSEVKVSKNAFLRDLIAYGISTTILICMIFIGVKLYVVPIVFISLYCTYAGRVIWEEIYFNNTANEDDALVLKYRSNELIIDNSVDSREIEPLNLVEEDESFLAEPISMKHEHQEHHMGNSEFREFMYNYTYTMHHKWHSKNLLEKLFFIIEYPFYFVMMITIPPGEKKDFQWIVGIAFPFTIPIFITLASTQEIGRIGE